MIAAPARLGQQLHRARCGEEVPLVLGFRRRGSPAFAVGSRAAELQDLLPGIINQLGPDNLANLKKLAETYQSGAAKPPTADADDEDVPDLVDNFEEASK